MTHGLLGLPGSPAAVVSGQVAARRDEAGHSSELLAVAASSVVTASSPNMAWREISRVLTPVGRIHDSLTTGIFIPRT